MEMLCHDELVNLSNMRMENQSANAIEMISPNVFYISASFSVARVSVTQTFYI